MTLPAILFGVLFFIIIVPFGVLILVLFLRGRNQSWKGTITDKLEKTHTDMDDDKTETFYTICIRLDDGKDVKISVDPARYNQWQIGDKLEKSKGESWPKKVE